MALTGNGNYIEDFEVGDVYKHSRGRTVSEMDNHLSTHMTMNTAQAHFNKEYMKTMMDGIFPERLVMGGFTMAIVVGLTAQYISENAIADLEYTAIRNLAPVFHGDTLFAETEILEVKESEVRPDAGILRCKIRGRNQTGKQVWEGERTLLIKKRSYWDDGAGADR